jgi:hypothetical protein
MGIVVTPATDAAAFAHARAIPPGYVRLTCGDPPLNHLVLLGPDPVTVTAGVAQWDVVGRPRETSMTVWSGVDPFEVSLSLMYDGFAASLKNAAKASQEPLIADLVSVSRGDSESPPGILAVEGLSVLPADEWLVTGIDYGDPIIDPSGVRVRQPLTLTLTEYVPPTKLAAKRKTATAASTKFVTIRARHGDTAAKIAKRRKLRSWTTIRDNNRKIVTKANQVLKEGTKLRVPATRAAASKSKSTHKGK